MARSGTPREIPPPLELECLQSLWKLGEGNVRDVQVALAPDRPLAYTTVMTVLERLARKGVVTRRKSGRAFLYIPAVSKDRLRERAVQQLLNTFFDGSRESLAAYLRNGTAEQAAEAAGSELDPALL